MMDGGEPGRRSCCRRRRNRAEPDAVQRNHITGPRKTLTGDQRIIGMYGNRVRAIGRL
jgi:hypothetical protein